MFIALSDQYFQSTAGLSEGNLECVAARLVRWRWTNDSRLWWRTEEELQQVEEEEEEEEEEQISRIFFDFC